MFIINDAYYKCLLEMLIINASYKCLGGNELYTHKHNFFVKQRSHVTLLEIRALLVLKSGTFIGNLAFLNINTPNLGLECLKLTFNKKQ